MTEIKFNTEIFDEEGEFRDTKSYVYKAPEEGEIIVNGKKRKIKMGDEIKIYNGKIIINKRNRGKKK